MCAALGVAAAASPMVNVTGGAGWQALDFIVDPPLPVNVSDRSVAFVDGVTRRLIIVPSALQLHPRAPAGDPANTCDTTTRNSGDVVVVDLDTGEARRVMAANPPPLSLAFEPISAVFVPGRRILVVYSGVEARPAWSVGPDTACVNLTVPITPNSDLAIPTALSPTTCLTSSNATYVLDAETMVWSTFADTPTSPSAFAADGGKAAPLYATGFTLAYDSQADRVLAYGGGLMAYASWANGIPGSQESFRMFALNLTSMVWAQLSISGISGNGPGNWGPYLHGSAIFNKRANQLVHVFGVLLPEYASGGSCAVFDMTAQRSIPTQSCMWYNGPFLRSHVSSVVVPAANVAVMLSGNAAEGAGDEVGACAA